MEIKSRIASIFKTSNLESSITGFPTFNLSKLELLTELEFLLPTNLRLGHLVEKIVSELIKASTNYKMLYENIQIDYNKKTIGEIDFIIENIKTKKLIHVELDYKFYLYDPNISSDSINNWIGPNRNDSLQKKLEKLKKKQFTLLYHKCAKSKINKKIIDNASQSLCFLVSLFIPFEYKARLNPNYEKAIEGYYIKFEKFISLDHSEKTYYLPLKNEWGMPPSENETWTDFNNIKKLVNKSILIKKAPLCWQKYKDSFAMFFIVWW
jgi:hypothetical protein